ncbi:pentapeptide repeat-containing protein [Oscillatoria sp. FACHB-1407]|uniref:WD40 domain-containing protein n=1 Tax=Oscillatoria sp. FACHB-1407 TaxID=2692847 RepID=UPI0016850472|nr:NB-ARC domain-containing protein [Oscillatoria sp. FACHB-1407]MBD2463515.1 pentapeptide repeat-containing protein [Oscillatoria sp. FACHB-1407]
MTPDEALLLLDHLLQEQKLKDLQELVFRYTWEGWTYPEIAKQLGYDTSHIRDVGYELWQQLSRSLGERVTKKNIQSVLRRLEQRQSIASTSVSHQADDQLGESSDDIQLPLEPSNQSLFLTDSLSEVSALDVRSLLPQNYWGESIDVSVFYGRTQELSRLQQWIVNEHCRLVAILGMGGMGKTTLTAKLVEELQDQFDLIIWQSFRNAPPVDEVFSQLLRVFSHRTGNPASHMPSAKPEEMTAQVNQIMEYLRTIRCLLVFDNLESILSASTVDTPTLTAGQLRSDYEMYGELCHRIGVERHKSCLIVTSREKLQLLAALEGDALPVRSFELKGLSVPDVRSMVVANGGYVASETDWQRLTDYYSGNPLALKIVSTTVCDLFEGNVPEFLNQGTIVFGDISTLLDEQFQRLSTLEKQVMYWLAINREWVSLADLRDDLVVRIPHAELMEALLSLRRRSLVEKNAGLFTLQPVVMEYVTQNLIIQICHEFETLEPTLLLSHALIKAQSKDYVRDSQIRLILTPIASHLINVFRSLKRVEEHLDRFRFQLQIAHFGSSGYGAGNLINVLRYLNLNLSGYDFSHLDIRQAHLQDVELHQVNFAHAHLSNCTFTQTFGSILSVAFSPDGHLLATGGVNAEVCVWQVATGQQLLACKGHSNWVLSVAFHPQGHLLASAGEDRTIRLWDVANGACLATLSGHTDYVHSIAFSPLDMDGEPLLASGSLDRTIKLWDVRTGHCLQTLEGHTSWLEQVVFSPTGQWLASSSGDRTIKLWDIATGECLSTLTGHEEEVTSIAFHPNQPILASGSGDRTIKLWDITTGECLNTLYGHSGRIWAIAFHASGCLASAAHDQCIKLWEINTGQCITTLQGHRSPVRAIAPHPHKPILASGSSDQSIRLWQMDTAECIKVLQGCSHQIWAIAFHPNGILLASGSHDQVIRVWNTQTGDCINTLRGHTSWIRAIAFSLNGNLIASGSGDPAIKLWNLETGQCVRTLQGHSSWIRAVAFSPDGRLLASASHDQTVRLWNFNTGEVVSILSTNTVWTRAIAFNQDGSLLATCFGASHLALWDVTTGKRLRILEGHTSQIWSVAFNPDGKTVATGSSDQTIKLWDVSTGTCLKTLTGHSGNVWSVAFTIDGTLLVSGGDDQGIRLWDLQTGQFKILSGHDRPVQWVACSPDGKTLASGSEDETIRIWQIETRTCLGILRADRPYEGMNITDITGLSDIQKESLLSLGAYTN